MCFGSVIFGSTAWHLQVWAFRIYSGRFGAGLEFVNSRILCLFSEGEVEALSCWVQGFRFSMQGMWCVGLQTLGARSGVFGC